MIVSRFGSQLFKTNKLSMLAKNNFNTFLQSSPPRNKLSTGVSGYMFFFFNVFSTSNYGQNYERMFRADSLKDLEDILSSLWLV